MTDVNTGVAIAMNGDIQNSAGLENEGHVVQVDVDDPDDGEVIDVRKPRANTAVSSSDESEMADETTVVLKMEPRSSKHSDEDEGDEPEVKVGFFALFRYADKLDVLLMVAGTLCMAALGVTQPVNLYFFGSLMNDFVSEEWAVANVSNAECPSIGASTNGTEFNRDFLVDVIINIYVVTFCGIGVAAFIVAYVGMSFWTWTGSRQVRRIQAAYFRAVMSQSIKWFDSRNTGELNARIIGDVDRLNDGFGDKMGTFIQWITTFLGGMALGFAISWRLMLVVMAACPLLVIMAAAMGRLVRTLLKKELMAYAKAGGVAEEIFSSIRTVAAFGGEKKAEERYSESLSSSLKGGVKKATASGLTSGLFWLILYCIISLAFWYGAVLIRTECLQSGAIIQVLMGVMIGSISLGNAAPVLANFANARAAAAVLYETIDDEVEIDSSSDEGIKAERLDGDIDFKDVHFSYPARPGIKILNGLNLSVKRGETVALVGESGCGKSTTIQLLQRYYDCCQGKVLVDGRDLKEYNLQSLRNYMGIVSQEPVLFDATIGENIRLGAKHGEEVTQEQIELAAQQSNCYDFISKLPKGFDTTVGERGVQLSGGQKQRIAIARALIRNPAILLLDEATSALDTQSEAMVQDAIDKASEGRTTIVIAHRLSTVRNASKICAFEKGVVKEEGTHSELMAKEGIYYSLVMKQQQEQKKEALELHQRETPLTPNSPTSDPLQSPFMPRARSGSKRSRSSSLRRSRFGSLKDVVSNGFTLGMDYDDDVEDVTEELPPLERRVLSRQLSGSSLDIKLENVVEQSMVKRMLSTQPSISITDLRKAETISSKEIWEMNRPEWGIIFIGTLASFLLGVGQPLYILLVTELIGSIAIPDFDLQERKITQSIGYLLILGFFTALLTLIQGFMLGLSGERMTSRLRTQYYSAVLRQEMGYFDLDENSVGHLTTRLATDASLVKGATGLRIGIFTQTIVSVLGIIVLSMVSTWELTLVMLICFPLVMLAGRVRQRVSSGYSAQDRATTTQGGQIAQEAMSNIRTVTSINRQKYFIEKFYNHFKIIYKQNLKGTFANGIAFATSASMQFFMYAIAFGLGGYFVVCDCLPWRSEPLTFFSIIRVFAAVTFGGVAAGRVFSQVPDYDKARLAAANIKSLLTRVSQIDPSLSSGEKPTKCEGEVKFTDIAFHYPTRKTVKVLESLNFTIKKGHVVALVGSSGCGKSTSISLLERFYNPISGSVSLDGTPIESLNLQWLRQHLGIVSQEPTLFDATIAENIAYGDNTRQVSMSEIFDASMKANAHNFITSLPSGYGTNVGARGTQLSGGQKQRIAIARALVRNPAVLLLDEATSALDTESEKIVQEALDEALKDRSAIVIAHRLSTIRNADKIGVVDGGRIVEIGTHQELIDLRGFYYNLVHKQL